MSEQTPVDVMQAEWNKKVQAPVLDRRRIAGVDIQFNPSRSQFMTSTNIPSLESDVFCRKWETIMANEQIGEIQLTHHHWRVVVNTSPIEQYHSLLVVEGHQPQRVTREVLEDIQEFSRDYPDISIGFNGWGAGASQNHLHFQLLMSEFPIETIMAESYPAKVYYSNEAEVIQGIMDGNQVDPKAYNILVYRGMVYIVFRKNEYDEKGVRRGFDSVFGRIPVMSKEEFETYTAADIWRLIASLAYRSDQAESK